MGRELHAAEHCFHGSRVASVRPDRIYPASVIAFVPEFQSAGKIFFAGKHGYSRLS
jgi:hypothetical protein